jgi:very-short-patch-repair endonuclease
VRDAPQDRLVARDVDAVVGPYGWATRAELIRRVHRGTVDAWVAQGKLIRLDDGVYATPRTAARWRAVAGALARTRGGVVSYSSALALWELVEPPRGPLHLTVAGSRSGRGSADVVLHRGSELHETVRRIEGIPVTCVERAVVDTWRSPGDLPRSTVRAAAIDGVCRRLCRPADLAYELDRRRRFPGRGELAELVRLLTQGCRSELEIWGCLHVLQHPGMPAFVQQRPVVVNGQTYFLDAAYEEVMLAVELDGAAWHGSRTQRERDIRRDALVATIGWRTLRYGYARLNGEPEACRRDILATYETRCRLFGVR